MPHVPVGQLRVHFHTIKHEKEQAKQVVVLQVHKESLQAELKMVREDIHRVTLELTQHQQRVDKLHAKHDVLVSRNATPDGEVHSQVRPLQGRSRAAGNCVQLPFLL